MDHVGEHEIKWGRKTFLELNDANDFRQIISTEGRISGVTEKIIITQPVS